MKAFPVDSIVTKLGEDGLPIYDRPYVSADLREVYANFFSNGVFMDDSTSLQVMNATGGMNVYVKAGTCHVNGAFGVETEQRTLQLDAASASLDRIDTIVARLDLAIEARSLDLYVLKGTPSEDPVRPSLTRNETVWELGLADVYLPKGIATISQGRISDTRLETKRCGAVTPFVEFDTTTLFEQLKQATQDAVDAMSDALGGTVAGNLQKYRRSLRVETEIPAAADLNKYQTVGNYGCSVAGNVAGILNKPSGLANPFLLFVHTVGSAVLQEAIDAVDGSRWCRAGSGAWVQTYDSSSVVPVSKGGTGGTSGTSALNNLGIKKWLLDNVFKVGYVWMSYTNASPSGIVGGTWTPITGRFPYFNAGSGTGGANSVALTVAQLPSHSHDLQAGQQGGEAGWDSSSGGSDRLYYGSIKPGRDIFEFYSKHTTATGSGGSVNIMPAYQTLYAWRRTA